MPSYSDATYYDHELSHGGYSMEKENEMALSEQYYKTYTYNQTDTSREPEPKKVTDGDSNTTIDNKVDSATDPTKTNKESLKKKLVPAPEIVKDQKMNSTTYIQLFFIFILVCIGIAYSLTGKKCESLTDCTLDCYDYEKTEYGCDICLCSGGRSFLPIKLNHENQPCEYVYCRPGCPIIQDELGCDKCDCPALVRRCVKPLACSRPSKPTESRRNTSDVGWGRDTNLSSSQDSSSSQDPNCYYVKRLGDICGKCRCGDAYKPNSWGCRKINCSSECNVVDTMPDGCGGCECDGDK